MQTIDVPPDPIGLPHPHNGCGHADPVPISVDSRLEAGEAFLHTPDWQASSPDNRSRREDMRHSDRCTGTRAPIRRCHYRFPPTCQRPRNSSLGNQHYYCVSTRRIGKLVDTGDQYIRAAGRMVFNAPIELLAILGGREDACTIRSTINSTHPTIPPPPNSNSATTGTAVPSDGCKTQLML